jgi:transposase-like protein
MFQEMSFSQFLKMFPDNETCFKEIVRIRYPRGIYCERCKEFTIHYRIKDRPAYSCKNCRNQIYPLAGTIFEKSTTSLRLWFYAMFLMTHTRGAITVKQLQRELGVTYKTAWRMYKRIRKLMAQNNGDLLSNKSDDFDEENKKKVHKWVFFKHFEISVVEKDAANS